MARTRSDAEPFATITHPARRSWWSRRLGVGLLGLSVLAAAAVPVFADGGEPSSTVTGAAGESTPPSQAPTTTTTENPPTTTEEPPTTTTEAPTNEATTTTVASLSDGESPSSSTTTTAPAEPEYEWQYPPLWFVVAEVDGRVEVGPQTYASSGCGQLVAEVSDHEIAVEGVRYPRGYGCSADVPARWEFVPLAGGDMRLTIRYRGEAGEYRITREGDTVRVVLVEGDDTSPPVSDEWWWIPDDILSVAVTSPADPDDPDDERGRRTIERLEERLLDEGARRFVPPAGFPIESRPAEPDGSYYAYVDGGPPTWSPWEEHDRDVQEGGIRLDQRVYRTVLEADDLQRIVDDAVADEECVRAFLTRKPIEGRSHGVGARSECPHW